MEKRYICKVCGKETKENIILIKERIIGTHEEFEYNECEHCKSLQLINIPEDMGKYYDGEYYSFQGYNKLTNFVMTHLKNSYFERDILGNILKKFLSDNKELFELMSKMVKEDKINYNSKILDIGCGSGIFLHELSEIGFKDLNGMEPFIEEEINKKEFKIYKSFIEDFNPNKTYDLIFLKDSLEHMENPYSSLKKAKELLGDEGYLIITIPVKTEYFFNLYGEYWFQLDAPRHLITFSLEGFRSMTENLNLNIEDIIFNSTPQAFIISEDFLKGKNMYSKDSFFTRNFLKNEIRKEKRKVNIEKLGMKTTFLKLNPIIEELNDNQNSEHAIFLLKKA